MRFRSVAFALALALALALAASPVAADDSMLVSKGVKGINLAPRIAVNDVTGDVLVVWSRLGTSATSEIWASLLKRTRAGDLKRRKPRVISGKTGYHANPRAVWLSSKKSFLVVWDTRRVPAAPSDILGRLVKKNGKATGDILTLVADGNENFNPSPAPDAPAAIDYSRIVSSARNGAAATQIVTLPLIRNLDPGKALVLDAFSIDETTRFAEEYFTQDQTCRVVVVQEGSLRTRATVWLLLLRENRLVDSLAFRGRSYLGSMRLGHGKVLSRFGLWLAEAGQVDWMHTVEMTVCTDLALKGGDAWGDRPVGVLERFRTTAIPRRFVANRRKVGDIVGDIVSVSAGEINSQGVDANGDAAGAPQILGQDVGDALLLQGAVLPDARSGSADAPDGVLAWLVRAGSGNEIRALPIKRE